MFDQEEFETNARTYLRFMRHGEEPHLDSPWEVMQDTITRDPESAWAIIRTMVDIAEDDFDLALVGTGPLEELAREIRGLLRVSN